jgi:hypothetical protein
MTTREELRRQQPYLPDDFPLDDDEDTIAAYYAARARTFTDAEKATMRALLMPRRGH